MADFLNNLVELYRKQLERHRNRSFLESAMAACALVAMADGNVSFRQRVRVDQVMETLEALRIFDPHEGVDLFNEFVDDIRKNPQEGHQATMARVVEEASRHPEQAELLIRICLAVSEVESEVPLTEQIEIVGLCNRLGIDPKGLGLYPDSSGKSHGKDNKD